MKRSLSKLNHLVWLQVYIHLNIFKCIYFTLHVVNRLTVF